jgi:hypothetical protein
MYIRTLFEYDSQCARSNEISVSSEATFPKRTVQHLAVASFPFVFGFYKLTTHMSDSPSDIDHN